MLINTILQKSDNIAVFKTLRNVTKRTKLNYEPKGREFESLMARQKEAPQPQGLWGLYFLWKYCELLLFATYLLLTA